MISSSFRDPSGFVFEDKGVVYRQINKAYREDYELLTASGLYDLLVSQGMLIRHSDAIAIPACEPERAFKIIKPERIPFISYPYEWSFSQLKDAALLTLKILKTALEKGMILKDASAYNIQFINCRPVMIDTLSFTKYNEGEPWAGYGQFCRHFLAPLSLMALKDIRLARLFTDFIDGVPLDLASKLLPFSSRFNPGLLIHIHSHAKSEAVHSEGFKERQIKVSKFNLLGIIDMLESAVSGLKWKPAGTQWADYYDRTNYTKEAFEHKLKIVREIAAENCRENGVIWDLGANTGVFSRAVSENAAQVLSFDIDPAAVEVNYLKEKEGETGRILPLVLDLTNPSPCIGWANAERREIRERGKPDLVLALALIHHLVIGNNTPFNRVAEYLHSLGGNLILEFVPREDSQTQKLLFGRKNLFTDYDIENMKNSFSRFYNVDREQSVLGTKRNILFMKRKGS